MTSWFATQDRVGGRSAVVDRSGVEVGRAQRTIFLCRYLRSRDEQREVNSGLNVMESWNGANS
jgi:TnpA family transposase